MSETISSEGTVTGPIQQKPLVLRVPATIISYICHPVFMPLIMAFVLSKLEPVAYAPFLADPGQKVWLINIGLTAVFYPLFSVLLLKKLDFISSYTMPTAKERTIPLMATMIFYFWVSHVFNSVPGTIPLSLKVLLLGNFWGLILIFIVNIFTKISLHTSAAGSMIGVVLVALINGSPNMALPLLVTIAVGITIGYARTVLGAHQRGDIWLGYILGILSQLGAYVYLK